MCIFWLLDNGAGGLTEQRNVYCGMCKLWKIAAEVPVKFHSDRPILNTNLAALRLYEILRKDVFSDIETGPRTRIEFDN